MTGFPPPDPTSPHPISYESANSGGTAAALVLCDHATNIVPDCINGGDLGLPPEDMGRHIAYDIGARGLSLELARLLDAPALLTRFSRLVIDPNRGEDDPTLVMMLYDGTIIPANRQVGAPEITARLDTFHRPYHRAITAKIDAMIAEDRAPTLLSIHSYTPMLRNRPPRPWHIGVLWDRDDRIARPLMDKLRAAPDLWPDLDVGDNQPYHGALEGDTTWQHGTMRGLRHVLIELRQDLIATPADQRLWAARLAPILAEVIAGTQGPGET